MCGEIRPSNQSFLGCFVGVFCVFFWGVGGGWRFLVVFCWFSTFVSWFIHSLFGLNVEIFGFSSMGRCPQLVVSIVPRDAEGHF